MKGRERALAIDVGTARTKISKNGGVVLDEPTVCAANPMDKRFEGFGEQALCRLQVESGVLRAVCPVEEGALTDGVAAEAMLKSYVSRALGSRYLRFARAVIAAPQQGSEIAKRSLCHAAQLSGALRVRMVDGLLAAAAGAGVNIAQSRAVLVADIGAGQSCAAVIACGGRVASVQGSVSGNSMDRALAQYLESAHGITVGRNAARALREALPALLREPAVQLRGWDLNTHLPAERKVAPGELCEALAPSLKRLAGMALDCIALAPGDAAGDLAETGIVLVGGGAKTLGLKEYLQQASGLKVTLPGEPEHCCALGMLALMDGAFLARGGREIGWFPPWEMEEEAAWAQRA